MALLLAAKRLADAYVAACDAALAEMRCSDDEPGRWDGLRISAYEAVQARAEAEQAYRAALLAELAKEQT